MITPTTTTYASYQTASFTIATAGPQTVQFLGVNPQGGDSTAFIDEVLITQSCAVNDSSFEVPALAANSYQYAPNGSPWQFSPAAGISTNGSAFTSGNPASAPDGTQVAFIQDTGSMSQSVYMPAGVYSLTYQAAQRADYTTKHYQELEVLVDGSPVGTATPTSSYYGLYQTDIFTVTTAGPHTIEFLGLNPTGGDNTAFIDEVAVTGTGSSINDGSFEWPEMPGVAATAYQYAPNGSPWQFSAGAGVSANGSVFSAGNPIAPDGVQAAFLQSTGNMSQTIDMNAGVYSISFDAAQRTGYTTTHYQVIEVLVDGAP